MNQTNQINQMRKTSLNLRRLLRRGPWENFASLIIILGVFMLMQPFSKPAFGYSFTVLLAGLICFTVVSHFPEE